MTTKLYEDYPEKDKITLLPAELVAPLAFEEISALISGKITKEMDEKVEKAIALHYFLGSWLPQVNYK